MSEESKSVDLDLMAEIYDEHAVRMATYLNRDLSHGERVNLAIQALMGAFSDRTIEDFERASDLIESKLQAGETVGASVAESIREIDGGVQ